MRIDHTVLAIKTYNNFKFGLQLQMTTSKESSLSNQAQRQSALLTLKQTGKTASMPIVLFDKSYWKSIVNFGGLIREGTIAKDDLSLFDFADDPEDAWRRLDEHMGRIRARR